jgi:hypothetical protein
MLLTSQCKEQLQVTSSMQLSAGCVVSGNGRSGGSTADLVRVNNFLIFSIGAIIGWIPRI